MTDFIAELKRRHVFKVGVAYVVTAWFVLQLADIVLPAFGAPAWVLKALIGLFVLCFPIALVLAWAFELTPDGVRRTEAAQTEGTPRRSAHRFAPSLNAITIVMLAAAVAVLAWRQFGGAARASGSPTAGAASTTDSAVAVPAMSVAVLPFVNMSGDSSREYLSDGITEEILNALAQIPGLQVAGRTSSFAFKGKNEDLSKIGRALHVAMVIEGSLQLAEDRVRIVAQLIDVRTDYHIWSQQYTRPLKNVFAVEDSISAAIADALKLKLSGRSGTRVASGTVDPRAHDFYLLGLHYWNLRSPADQGRAMDYFHRAIALDSTYAGAWAALAEALVTPATAGIDTLPPSVSMPLAEAAARKALAIDSTLPEAHTALAFARMFYDYDWQGARAEFDRALAADPDYPTGHSWLGEWYAAQGRTAEAVTSARRAEQLDPLSMIIAWTVGRELIFDRRYDEAREQYEKMVARPSGGGALHDLVRVALLQGDTLAAARYLLRSPGARVPDSLRARVEEAVREGNPAAMRGLVPPFTNPIVMMARRLLHQGPPPAPMSLDSAFAVVQRAVDAHNVGDAIVNIVADPDMDPLRDDPRYQRILQRVGLEEAGRRIASRLRSH